MNLTKQNRMLIISKDKTISEEKLFFYSEAKKILQIFLLPLQFLKKKIKYFVKFT